MPKAAVKFRIESQAIAQLARRLAELDRKVARKAIRDGINEATKMILADAKSLVPVRTGQLRKSLGRKVRAIRGGGVVYGVVKPRSGRWVGIRPGEMGPFAGRTNAAGTKRYKSFKKKFAGVGYVNPVKYAHLVEYGRGPVRPKSKKIMKGGGVFYGTHARAVAPRPFLRPAWERNRRRVVGIIIKHLHLGMSRFYAKARSGRRAA